MDDCFICCDEITETDRKSGEVMHLPCANCKKTEVHSKCIYAWYEQTKLKKSTRRWVDQGVEIVARFGDQSDISSTHANDGGSSSALGSDNATTATQTTFGETSNSEAAPVSTGDMSDRHIRRTRAAIDNVIVVYQSLFDAMFNRRAMGGDRNGDQSLIAPLAQQAGRMISLPSANRISSSPFLRRTIGRESGATSIGERRDRWLLLNEVFSRVRTPRVTCPLCRKVMVQDKLRSYIPSDIIRSRKFGEIRYKAEFFLNPVLPKAGFVRCFIRSVKRERKTRGRDYTTTVYDMFLQKPSALEYPAGEIPKMCSPHTGDIFLARVVKTPNGSFLTSSISKKRKNRSSSSSGKESELRVFLQDTGGVGKALKTNALIRKSMGQEEIGKFIGIISGENDSSEFSFNINSGVKSYLISKTVEKSEVELTCWNECVGKLKFLHKPSKGRVVGIGRPRNLVFCIPEVKRKRCFKRGNKDKTPVFYSSQVEQQKLSIDTASKEVLGTFSSVTQGVPLRRSKRLKSANDNFVDLASGVNNPSKANDNPSQLVGKSITPKWQSNLNAFSLDFRGRACRASKKNMQLCLQRSSNGLKSSGGIGSSDPFKSIDDSLLWKTIKSMPDGKENSKIKSMKSPLVFQLGMVERKVSVTRDVWVEIFTVDYRFPLSPAQALLFAVGSLEREK